MQRRWIAALAALVIAAPAEAQFTTFIAPPTPVKDSIKAAVAAEQRAVSDSITQTKITDMKTWVDSAAGIAPVRGADSLMATDTVATATRVSNGAIAPETASSLPLLLALGGGMMLLGLGLQARPRPKPQRIDE